MHLDPSEPGAADSASADAPRPLSARLKEDNWKLHAVAERSEGARLLTGPDLTLAGYVAMLRAQLPIHEQLDTSIAAARDAEPALAELVTPEQLTAPAIERDLQDLSPLLEAETGGVVRPHDDPPGVARCLDAIHANADDPWYLLGLHYVRTGQTNGNRYLAGRIRKVLGLDERLSADRLAEEPRAGTLYLDPFGRHQRRIWGDFKQGIDALAEGRLGPRPQGLNADEQDRVFNGTRDAYLFAINPHEPHHQDADRLLELHAATLDKAAFDEAHHVHEAAAAHDRPNAG